MSISLSSRAHPIRSILLCSMLSLALSACVTAPPVFLSANDCSSIIPDDWALGVPSAPLPQDKTAGGLATFGDAQTGQLDKANARTKDTATIVQKCEARDKAAAKSLQPKAWWKFWQ